METTLRLLRQDGSVAATGKSAADGTFRLAALPAQLPAGGRLAEPGRRLPPVDVTVEPGRVAHADVSCDTGIR